MCNIYKNCNKFKKGSLFMSFWDRFYELCTLKGVKPNGVAKELGFSNAVCSQWKKGTQKPSAEKLTKIAEYFNVSESYLLYGKEKISAGIELSAEEIKIIELIRSLSDEKKEIFKKFLNSL
jgi:transcriptional regulator with XRE-family HTH domain